MQTDSTSFVALARFGMRSILPLVGGKNPALAASRLQPDRASIDGGRSDPPPNQPEEIMTEEFYIRLDHPWDEPNDPPFEPPTDDQVRRGLVIVITECTMSANRTFKKGERYMVDAKNAEALVDAKSGPLRIRKGAAHRARGRTCRRGPKQTGVKAKAAKPAKKKAKADGE